MCFFTVHTAIHSYLYIYIIFVHWCEKFPEDASAKCFINKSCAIKNIQTQRIYPASEEVIAIITMNNATNSWNIEKEKQNKKQNELEKQSNKCWMQYIKMVC